MKNKITAFILLAALALAVCVNLSSCGITVPVSANDDLMAGVEPRQLGDPGAVKEADAAAAADFAVRLFRACADGGENVLVSPLSVLAALSMTANGAKGQTLSEMETVLGLDKDDLNSFFRSYMNALKPTEKSKLSLANSIWFRDGGGFEANRDFLSANADYYGADAYRAPFDGSTLKKLNDWVKEKTDGKIPSILDSISRDDVMFLVNALAFDAEWETVYFENQIRDGEFTREDGVKKTVPMMHGAEWDYLDDGSATGFIKYYSGGRFAFVAMLPNEGVSLSDYIASLDGEKLRETISSPESGEVLTMIPKFGTEYSVPLAEVLKGMGMRIPFETSADFSGLGTSEYGPIMIGEVFHKTFISVDERGTKAGAATIVEMKEGSAFMEEPKTVYLDRPFVYMLVDTETNLPFFIGALTDAGE